ncbi:MAG: hypothetical protein GWN67_21490 [Phycisphaerae bacterium]|nr:hypothetical protein [Phycisphaerae bacterium]NIP53127.1 hypothetical protein [Phycisphaerae bacterium]NIS53507.1 hypothetical protein [Phycisphaerae bacterium]NIU09700.1 hypothetical protein [Phycisphaerae bacterium]NIU58856.1 hypothetical protein [Phycisphaerae bacterium]
MKSFIRTIFMLVIIALLTVSSTLAQEIPDEVVPEEIDSLQPAVVTPSPPDKAMPPPPTPPTLGATSFPSVAAEADVASGFEVEMMEPSEGLVTYFTKSHTAGRSSSRKVLVIPNAEIKTEDLAAITQDLQVMAHIFHKIFTGPRLTEGIFIKYDDFFGRGSPATEAVYLQGYGALFLQEVNIPLSSPPRAKETQKDESTQKDDSVWNQAKQEIFHPSPYRKTKTNDPTERYDEKKVEELKSRLIKALKHAANMRNLEPDDSIILTVIGKGLKSNPFNSYGVSGGVGIGGYGGGYGGGGYGGGAGGYGGAGYGVGYGSSVDEGASNRRGSSRYVRTRRGPSGIGISAPTVLTIRAKKSDVDAFSKGELDYDKFREKVQILTYLSLGPQAAGGYSMFRYSKPPETPVEAGVPDSANR